MLELLNQTFCLLVRSWIVCVFRSSYYEWDPIVVKFLLISICLWVKKNVCCRQKWDPLLTDRHRRFGETRKPLWIICCLENRKRNGPFNLKSKLYIIFHIQYLSLISRISSTAFSDRNSSDPSSFCTPYNAHQIVPGGLFLMSLSSIFLHLIFKNGNLNEENKIEMIQCQSLTYLMALSSILGCRQSYGIICFCCLYPHCLQA